MFGIGKWKKEALVGEVDDSRRIVYDFRRRLKNLFESYRPADYRIDPELDESVMLPKLDEHLSRIFEGCLDDGNGNVLDRLIWGPVREGKTNLAKQNLEHQDMIARFGARFYSDYPDIKNILDEHKRTLKRIEEDYALTCRLWDKYTGYKSMYEEVSK